MARTHGRSSTPSVINKKLPKTNSPLAASSFFSLEPNLWHMEVLRPGVELELQLLGCSTGTAMWDPNCICDLYHSLQQSQILNPLSQAKDQTSPHGYQSGSLPLSYSGNSFSWLLIVGFLAIPCSSKGQSMSNSIGLLPILILHLSPWDCPAVFITVPFLFALNLC